MVITCNALNICISLITSKSGRSVLEPAAGFGAAAAPFAAARAATTDVGTNVWRRVAVPSA